VTRAPAPGAGLPKAEIHLHLEGSIDLETLLAIRARRGQTSGEDDRRRLQALYRHEGFMDFLMHFRDLCEELRAPEDFALATTGLAERLDRDLVRHAEVMCSPAIFVRRGPPADEILDAVLEAAAGVRRAGGPRLLLLLDGVRHWGPASFEPQVEIAARFRERGVVGVGLGGDESGSPARDFRTAYREARRLGLRTTIHAGEFVGPQSVWEAIDVLEVDRIGHGIRAAEDEALLRTLAARRVPLECCPTSNLRTGVVRDWAEHPLPQLVRAGARVTVNSDDPAMFGTSLGDEWIALRDRLGLDADAVRRIGRATIESAFMGDDERAALLRDYDRAAAVAAAEETA
jgi:adenosine deaminase